MMCCQVFVLFQKKLSTLSTQREVWSCMTAALRSEVGPADLIKSRLLSLIKIRSQFCQLLLRESHFLLMSPWWSNGTNVRFTGPILPIGDGDHSVITLFLIVSDMSRLHEKFVDSFHTQSIIYTQLITYTLYSVQYTKAQSKARLLQKLGLNQDEITNSPNIPSYAISNYTIFTYRYI